MYVVQRKLLMPAIRFLKILPHNSKIAFEQIVFSYSADTRRTLQNWGLQIRKLNAAEKQPHKGAKVS